MRTSVRGERVRKGGGCFEMFDSVYIKKDSRFSDSNVSYQYCQQRVCIMYYEMIKTMLGGSLDVFEPDPFLLNLRYSADPLIT